MANETMTRKSALEVLIRECKDDNRPEVAQAVAVAQHMLEVLNKPKASTAGQTTKAGAENRSTVATMMETLHKGDTINCAWITAHGFAVTPQKAVAVAKAAIDMGLLEKFQDGKKTAYRVL